MRSTKLIILWLLISVAAISQTRPEWAGINLVWAPEYGDTLSVVKSIQGV